MTTFAFMAMPGMVEWIIVLFVLLIMGAGVALVIVLVTRKSDDEDEGRGSGIGTVLIVLAVAGGILILLCGGVLGLFAFTRSQQRAFMEPQVEILEADEAIPEDTEVPTPADDGGTVKSPNPNEKAPEPARPETQPEAEQ